MYYWIFGHFLLNALPVILYISLRQSPAARTPVLLLQGLQSSAARTAVLGCKDCGQTKRAARKRGAMPSAILAALLVHEMPCGEE